jgi:hypothetical protein
LPEIQSSESQAVEKTKIGKAREESATTPVITSANQENIGMNLAVIMKEAKRTQMVKTRR